MTLRKTFFIVYFLLLVFGVSGAPSSTECTNNPGSAACQNPDYTDDQDEYLYDLRASWVFNGGSAPDSSGPTVFHGGAAGSLTGGLDYDSASGIEKECYI
jgi:hypothetical protein